MIKKNKNKIIAVLLIVLFSFLDTGISMSATATEHEIKAAFIYNFAKLTQWKNGTIEKNYITLCIHDNKHFNNHLNELSGKKALDNTLKVSMLGDSTPLTICDMLFIDKKHSDILKNHINVLLDNSILTIGNYEGFIQDGGIIGFKKRENKINFTINIKKAKESGLLIDSRLLKYGTIYND